MNFSTDWKDYSIIATGEGEKLERWGNFILLRPDPQIIWKNPKGKLSDYDGIDAKYERAKEGGGKWIFKRELPKDWIISWKSLKFKLKLMGFKHTGIFPEQAFNWQKMIDIINLSKRQIKVLNLFAYTGGATLACASAGADVVHVDASKGMVERAKENLHLSRLENAHVRFIVDDCEKFVTREIKRENRYDAIIMDPPSYGRGPNDELWKLEDKLFDFVKLTKKILSEKPLFILINSYTTGLSCGVLENISKLVFGDVFQNYNAYDLGIKTEENLILPCGTSCFSL